MAPNPSKRYVFTWNNPTSDIPSHLEKFYESYCTYLVYGNETSESGTPHLQGYFNLKQRNRVTGLKKLIGKHPALFAAKGTSQEASDYCKKENDFVEFGILPTPGQRTDLNTAIADIKDGATMADVAENHSAIFVKYGRGLRDLRLTLEVPYNHPSTRGLWIYGPPGTGKSHAARHIHPNAYLKSQSKWFDGYNGQEAMILDDLDTNVLGHYLKIWSDKYACTGETKGGTIHLRHKIFIVTSNYHPSDLWTDNPQMLSAIERRFTIVHKTSKNQLIDHLVLKE